MGAPAKYKIGEKFNKLTLMERLRGDIWRCRCECGTVIEHFARPVASGRKRSCGCMSPGPKRKVMVGNKPGEVFGALTLVEYIGGSWWRCKCECGKYKDVLASKLKTGNTTSCGCGAYRNKDRNPIQSKEDRNARQRQRYYERKEAEPPPPRRMQKKLTPEMVLIRKMEGTKERVVVVTKEESIALELQNIWAKRS